MNDFKKEKTTEDRKLFEVWFVGLLHASETATMREVLHGQKENLWGEWQKVQPYYFIQIEGK
jgi:chloramphenicol 3-O-phosphotransferase